MHKFKVGSCMRNACMLQCMYIVAILQRIARVSAFSGRDSSAGM